MDMPTLDAVREFYAKAIINYKSFEGIDIAEKDLNFLELTGSILQNCNFHAVNLSNADLLSSKLMNVKFIDCDLSNSDISTIWASDTTFENVNFDGASIIDSSFIRCRFIKCSFDGIIFSQSQFRDCTLSDFSFVNSTVTLNNFYNCTISSTELKGTFHYQIFEGCTFVDTNMDIALFGYNFGIDEEYLLKSIGSTDYLNDLRDKFVERSQLVNAAILSISLNNGLSDSAIMACIMAIIKMLEKDILIKSDEMRFIKNLLEYFHKNGMIAPITIIHCYNKLSDVFCNKTSANTSFEKASENLSLIRNTLFFMYQEVSVKLQNNLQGFDTLNESVELVMEYSSEPKLEFIYIVKAIKDANNLNTENPIFIKSEHRCYIEWIHLLDTYIPYIQTFCAMLGIVVPIVVYKKQKKDLAVRNNAPSARPLEGVTSSGAANISLQINNSVTHETEHMISTVVTVINKEQIFNESGFCGYNRENVTKIEVNYGN